MTKNDYIIPEQCMKCGAIFDLLYDLSEKENPYVEEVRGKIGRKLSEYLCWNCKKEMIVNLTEGEDTEENHLVEENILDDELD